MRMKTLLLAILVSGLLVGCKVGPNYHRPAVQTPAAYRDLAQNPQLQAQTASYADLPWWQVFQLSLIHIFIGRFNGKPGAIIAAYQLPGSNAVDAAAGVKKLMAQMKQRFPDDMDFAVSLDTTLSVTEGIKEIVKTLIIALALVILVVYLFLQSWRSTLIPLLAVPVSLIGTFIFFPLFGFSVNTLSLFGLVLAIGLVVDDAIVVVEGCLLYTSRCV